MLPGLQNQKWLGWIKEMYFFSSLGKRKHSGDSCPRRIKTSVRENLWCLCHVDEQILVLSVYLYAHVFVSIWFSSEHSCCSHKHEFKMLKTEYWTPANGNRVWLKNYIWSVRKKCSVSRVAKCLSFCGYNLDRAGGNAAIIFGRSGVFALALQHKQNKGFSEHRCLCRRYL